MTAATMKAKIVHIRIEEGEAGLLFATSPDLKGLLVAKRTRQELRQAIPLAIADLYRACGTDVVVTPAEDDDDEAEPWVAVPRELLAAVEAPAAS